MTLRRVRSLVRLNSINLSPNIIREAAQSLGVVAPSVPIAEVFWNWEVNISGDTRVESAFGPRHLPSHLVKGRPEAVQKFSEFHPKHRLEGFHLKPFDISSILRVVLGNNGVRFFHVSGHVPIESV